MNIKLKKKATEIEQGSYWKYKDGDVYILSQIQAGLYCLVSLNGGNRFVDPVDKIGKVFGGARDSFTEMEVEFED